MTCLKASLLTNEIQKSFSQAAAQYDRLTAFHQKYALRLLDGIFSLNPSLILDVGCGTGYLSEKIKQKFPQSIVTGLDFSAGMIEVAQAQHKGIDFILADANQMPFQEKCFDVVVSNFAYQWMRDLSKSFLEAHRVLRRGGQLSATLFGYQTCEELFSSLENSGFNVEELNRFSSVSQVQEHLDHAGFSQVQVQQEMAQIAFKDLWQLLLWLKAIGANKLSPGKFVGPRTLHKASELCLKNFSYGDDVLISFEIIKVQAMK